MLLKHAPSGSEKAAEDTVHNTPDASPRSDKSSTVRSRSTSNTKTDSSSSSMAARSDDDMAVLRSALLSRKSVDGSMDGWMDGWVY